VTFRYQNVAEDRWKRFCESFGVLDFTGNKFGVTVNFEYDRGSLKATVIANEFNISGRAIQQFILDALENA
jgi:hypothetical protein